MINTEKVSSSVTIKQFKICYIKWCCVLYVKFLYGNLSMRKSLYRLNLLSSVKLIVFPLLTAVGVMESVNVNRIWFIFRMQKRAKCEIINLCDISHKCIVGRKIMHWNSKSLLYEIDSNVHIHFPATCNYISLSFNFSRIFYAIQNMKI